MIMTTEQRELIHVLVDKVLTIQNATEHYARLEIIPYKSQRIQIRVMRGKYDAFKDFLIQEEFDSEKLDGSDRFARTLELLDRLIEEAKDVCR